MLLGATGMRNLALFLTLFELSSLVRFFLLGHNFTDITKLFGTDPTEGERTTFLIAIAAIACIRFKFVLDPREFSAAQLNMILHAVEVPVVGYVMHTKGGFPTSLEGSSWAQRKGAVIFCIIVLNAVFFSQWYQALVSGEEVQSGSGAAGRRAFSSVSVSASPARTPSPAAASTKSKSKSKSKSKKKN